MRHWFTFLLFLAVAAGAQAQAGPATSTQVATAHNGSSDWEGAYGYANILVGSAVATGGGATKLVGAAAITVGGFELKPIKKGFGVAPALELGVIGPIPHGHAADGIVSLNATFETVPSRHDEFPFLTGGYSRIFVTGNALNFGVGLDLPYHQSDRRIVRIEIRDYYLATGPRQHILELRIGLGSLFSDSD